MFKRKIYGDLKKWKEISNGSTAMLIEGARRVGKSTIAEEFGKNEYKSYILIDFSNVSDDVRTAFENGDPDLDTLFLKIRTFFNTELYERESLIIFDEVQFCPKARQRIKHLVKDGRYDYIETGSLISIKKNVKDILIPSDEESIEMNPMDFEEFLWACGNDTLVDSLRKIDAEDKPIESIIHKIAMENLRKYMIVGGMPEAVLAFTKDMTTFSNAEYVKKKTIKLYFDDCAKAPTSNENTTRILKAVPVMLSRHRKVFSPGVVKKGYSAYKLSNPIQWLKESKIVNTCESCDDPSAALGLTVNENRFKFYLADTGLLSTLAFGQDVIKKESFYNDIINDRLQMNKGMLIENLVAQMLKASGHELYFWEHRVDNKTYEVDFLLSDGKKVIPVEVKSGKRTSHTSLDVFVEKYQKRTNNGVIITPRLKDKVDNYRRVPLYMAMFL